LYIHNAKKKNEMLMKSYAKMSNKFTKRFANGFCNDNGEADWDRLVEYNSGRKEEKYCTLNSCDTRVSLRRNRAASLQARTPIPKNRNFCIILNKA